MPILRVFSSCINPAEQISSCRQQNENNIRITMKGMWPFAQVKVIIKQALGLTQATLLEN